MKFNTKTIVLIVILSIVLILIYKMMNAPVESECGGIYGCGTLNPT